MYDKVERRADNMDGMNLKNYLDVVTNRIKVLIGFCIFLIAVIITLCIFIYYQEKAHQRQRQSPQQDNTSLELRHSKWNKWHIHRKF